MFRLQSARHKVAPEQFKREVLRDELEPEQFKPRLKQFKSGKSQMHAIFCKSRRDFIIQPGATVLGFLRPVFVFLNHIVRQVLKMFFFTQIRDIVVRKICANVRQRTAFKQCKNWPADFLEHLVAP